MTGERAHVSDRAPDSLTVILYGMLGLLKAACRNRLWEGAFVVGQHWIERFSPPRLRALRELRGLSQVNMAELIGQKQSAYSRYETGKHKPTPRTLRKMAAALEAELDELLEAGPPDMPFLRARRELNQSDVAAALGRSHVWYRRVERRETCIPSELAGKLAELLDVDPRVLDALVLVCPTNQV